MARSGDPSRRNRITMVVLLCCVAGMGGVAYASVPLYQLFCQVTGYGGTTGTSAAAPGQVGDRVITVRFNSDVNPSLDWRFQPVQNAMDVRVGEQALALYSARNLGAETLTGTATFNVTPAKAGIYFNKIDCFCFTEQTLEAGAEARMPVSFFIDPEILRDRNLDDITTITLSYTFFRSESERGDKSAALSKPAAGVSAAAYKLAHQTETER